MSKLQNDLSPLRTINHNWWKILSAEQQFPIVLIYIFKRLQHTNFFPTVLIVQISFWCILSTHFHFLKCLPLRLSMTLSLVQWVCSPEKTNNLNEAIYCININGKPGAIKTDSFFGKFQGGHWPFKKKCCKFSFILRLYLTMKTC